MIGYKYEVRTVGKPHLVRNKATDPEGDCLAQMGEAGWLLCAVDPAYASASGYKNLYFVQQIDVPEVKSVP